jgi:membrane protease YdiL (CAAX protease family)
MPTASTKLWSLAAQTSLGVAVVSFSGAWPRNVAGLVVPMMVGAITGALLYVALAGTPRRLRAVALVSRSRLAARALLTPWKAFNEESLWRAGILVGLTQLVATPLAVALSAVLFALMHSHAAARARPVVAHTLTGGVFAGLFVLFGSVTACWAAHTVFNLCVELAADTRRVEAVRNPRRPVTERA